MRKILIADAQKCTGCKLCELFCSLHHTKEFSPSKARIRVVEFHEELVFVPMTCWHCEEAACMEACPANAIRRDHDTAAVVIDAGRCIGCKMCIMACPFGAITHAGGETPLKCDLCEGKPHCAMICPTGAIRYDRADALMEDRRRSAALRLRTPALQMPEAV